MKLYDTGVYLQNGQEIIPENQADLPVAKEEAAKNTIAYSIRKHRLPRHRRSLGRNQFHTGTGSAERCPSLSHPKRQPFSGNR